jgi:hypothetical protein
MPAGRATRTSPVGSRNTMHKSQSLCEFGVVQIRPRRPRAGATTEDALEAVVEQLPERSPTVIAEPLWADGDEMVMRAAKACGFDSRAGVCALQVERDGAVTLDLSWLVAVASTGWKPHFNSVDLKKSVDSFARRRSRYEFGAERVCLSNTDQAALRSPNLCLTRLEPARTGAQLLAAFEQTAAGTPGRSEAATRKRANCPTPWKGTLTLDGPDGKDALLLARVRALFGLSPAPRHVAWGMVDTDQWVRTTCEVLQDAAAVGRTVVECMELDAPHGARVLRPLPEQARCH